MFGHQDNQDPGQNDQNSSASDTQQSTSTDNPPIQNQDLVSDLSLGSSSDDPEPPANNGIAWQQPGEAPDAPDKLKDAVSPAGGFPQALSSKEPPTGLTPASNMHIRASVPHDGELKDATNEELVEVKDKALDDLYPLIDKLDQTPDEHFRTLMMIIQASDNHALIKQAYQIAQTISDEKARAQALLDVINEINYFTQQPEI